MTGYVGLWPGKRLYKQPTTVASATAEPLQWAFGLHVAGYKYKITHTVLSGSPCRTDSARWGVTTAYIYPTLFTQATCVLSRSLDIYAIPMTYTAAAAKCHT